MRNNSKFVVDNIITAMAVGIVGIAGIIINIIVANKYSANDLGVFLQSIAIFSILSSVVIFGMNRSIVRHVAISIEKKQERSNYFWSALIVVFFNSLLVLSVFFLITEYVFVEQFSGEIITSVKIIVLALPVFAVNNIMQSYFNGLRNMYSYSYSRILRWLSVVFFIFIFSYIETNLPMLMYSFLFSEVILLFFNINRIKPLLVRFGKDIADYVKENITYGSKVIVAQLMTMLTEKSDILIVGILLGNASAGVYGFAVNIANGLKLTSTAVQQNFNPIVAKNIEDYDNAAFLIMITKIKKTMLIVFTVLGLALIMAYYILVSLLMDDNIFYENFSIGVILITSSALYCMTSWGGGILAMTGHLIDNIKRTMLTFMITVTSLITLTYFYKIDGSAYAVLVSTISGIILLHYFVKKNTQIEIL